MPNVKSIANIAENIEIDHKLSVLRLRSGHSTRPKAMSEAQFIEPSRMAPRSDGS
jgi:hypothetical protein